MLQIFERSMLSGRKRSHLRTKYNTKNFSLLLLNLKDQFVNERHLVHQNLIWKLNTILYTVHISTIAYGPYAREI